MSITIHRLLSAAPVIPPPSGPTTLTVFAAPDRWHGVAGDNKHVTAALLPGTTKIYFEGGDYPSNFGSYTSYRQQTWSLDYEAFRTAGGGNTGWALEYPFDGVGAYGSTSVQPKKPDHVGWSWDSNRNIFWMVPGLMVGASGDLGTGETSSETSDTNYIYRTPMKFDPYAVGAQRWTNTGAPFGPTGFTLADDAWHTVYDPVNDVIFRGHRLSGSPPNSLDIFNCATGTWLTRVTTTPLDTIDIGASQWAADYTGRKIYVVDGGQFAHLWSINMDSPYTVTDLGKAPGPIGYPGGADAMCNTVWDSANRVLIFHREADYRCNELLSDIDRMIYVYDPSRRTWEYIQIIPSPMDSPTDRWQSRGSVFLPATSEVMYYGGSNG